MTERRGRSFVAWSLFWTLIAIAAVAQFLTPAVARKQNAPVPIWETALQDGAVIAFMLAMVVAMANIAIYVWGTATKGKRSSDSEN